MFPEILKALRLQNGLTQKQIADILNIDRSTYSYYELGTSHPGYDGLIRLAQIFNVTTDFLIGNESAVSEFRDDSSLNLLNSLELPVSVSDLTRDEQRLILMYRVSESKSKFFELLEEAEPTE